MVRCRDDDGETASAGSNFPEPQGVFSCPLIRYYKRALAFVTI